MSFGRTKSHRVFLRRCSYSEFSLPRRSSRITKRLPFEERKLVPRCLSIRHQTMHRQLSCALPYDASLLATRTRTLRLTSHGPIVCAKLIPANGTVTFPTQVESLWWPRDDTDSQSQHGWELHRYPRIRVTVVIAWKTRVEQSTTRSRKHDLFRDCAGVAKLRLSTTRSVSKEFSGRTLTRDSKRERRTSKGPSTKARTASSGTVEPTFNRLSFLYVAQFLE